MVGILKYLFVSLLLFQAVSYSKIYSFNSADIKNIPARDLYDVLTKLKELSYDVVAELAAKNKAAQKIYDSYNKFYKQVSAWHEISEKIYYNVR